MKFKLIITSIICGAMLLSAFLTSFWIINKITDDKYLLVKREKWNGERYVGWDMPCNYTNGSDKDNQRYLDCGNGIVYEKIGISPSVTYFDPNDSELNYRYCKGKDEVATFSYENPITKTGEGKFVDCIEW